MFRWLVYSLIGLLVALLVIIGTAPARFIDRVLESGTLGRIRLAEAEGTVWQGRGRVVLVDTAVTDAGRFSLPGVAIPGRVSWSVKPWPLIVGMVDANVSIDGMPAPVRLQGSVGEVQISAGSISLPSVDLTRLGSPWNSVRPSGALSVRWDTLTLRGGQMLGKAAIELRDASSAVTPVRPLGSYRLEIDGRGPQAELQLRTVSGPLKLSGKGQWTARSGLRLDAEAVVDPAESDRLKAFLALIGRREGDRTVIRIGA
jgi:general secretion pathway protein N